MYTIRVELEGTSFDMGVDGGTSITGPGEVTFAFHQATSDPIGKSKPDAGPVTKFLYSL